MSSLSLSSPALVPPVPPAPPPPAALCPSPLAAHACLPAYSFAHLCTVPLLTPPLPRRSADRDATNCLCEEELEDRVEWGRAAAEAGDWQIMRACFWFIVEPMAFVVNLQKRHGGSP